MPSKVVGTFTDEDIADMKEAVPEPKEKLTKQSDIPEAVASVTFTIRTKKGYNCLFTVRDRSGIALLEKMDDIEGVFTEKGITPQPERTFGSRFGPKKEVKIIPDRKCPLCGADLVEATTKDGKTFIKCSTQKYDFSTKQVQGCSFVEWNK